jgi:hypothetical protein
MQESLLLENIKPTVNRDVIDMFLNEIKLKEYLESSKGEFYEMKIHNTTGANQDDLKSIHNIKGLVIKQIDPYDDEACNNFQKSKPVLGPNRDDPLEESQSSLHTDFGVVTQQEQVWGELHSRMNQTKQAKIGGPDRDAGGPKNGRLTVTTFDNNFNNKRAELMFSQKLDFEIDVPDLVNKFMGQKMLLTEYFFYFYSV